MSSQPPQGSSLQQGDPPAQNQPAHNNVPRVSSAQRLLLMQQPGGGVPGMRPSPVLPGGPHFNQQLSPSLPQSLSVSSPPGSTMPSNMTLQQQQQQQLLAQRGYPLHQQQASMPAQQRLQQQVSQQASQLSQQNQLSLQGQQVPPSNQSLSQQLHPSSRPLLYAQPQQMATQFGHHLQQQQAGVAPRLGTAGGNAQGQVPGLSAMLSVPSSQSFAGMQSQLSSSQQALLARQKQGQGPLFQPGVSSSPSMQTMASMGLMASGGHSVTGGLATQLARASAPGNPQQQRAQQQVVRQQQQPQQQPLQQPQQSTVTSPSKPQLAKQPSTGSLGSQMQSLGSAQHNSSLLSQAQSWLPAGQMKPMHTQSPSASYQSQLQQHQLQASQQRSQQQQAPVSSAGMLQSQTQTLQSQLQLQQPSAQQQQQALPLSMPVSVSVPVPAPGPAPGPATAPAQQRLQGAAQRPLTPTQPTTTGQTGVVATGHSSQTSDANGQILGKRSIEDLVAQVDPREKLDADVEDILLEIADDFVETVTSFACALAKHRKSPVLEAKDVLLHLERNWHMTIPGFSGDEYRAYKKPAISENHKQRLAVVRKSLASTHPHATQEKTSNVPGDKPNSGSQTVKVNPSSVLITSPRLPRV